MFDETKIQPSFPSAEQITKKHPGKDMPKNIISTKAETLDTSMVAQTLNEAHQQEFQEIFFTAKTIDYISEEEIQTITNFLFAKDTSFQEKAIILHTLIETVAQLNDEEMNYAFDSLFIPQYIEKETNFFLRGLITSRYNYQREISIDDSVFFTKSTYYSAELKKEFSDETIKDVFCSESILETILQNINKLKTIEWDIQNTHTAAISSNLFAVYNDGGEITEIFPNEVLKIKSPISITTCQLITKLVIDLERQKEFPAYDQFKNLRIQDAPQGYTKDKTDNIGNAYPFIHPSVHPSNRWNFNGYQHEINEEISKTVKILQLKLPEVFLDFNENASIKNMLTTLNERLAKIQGELFTKPIDIKQELSQYLPQQKSNTDTYVNTYKIMASFRMRHFLKQELSIQLEEIPLPTQIFLLRFLSEASEDQIKKVHQFIDNPDATIRNIRLNTFLSIGQGGQEMGEKILTIAEKIPQDIASAIFAKYVDIADNATQAEQYILANFNTQLEAKDNTSSVARDISEKMLIKGKDLLVDFADHHSGDATQLLTKLETVKTENEILKASIQTLVKEKHINTLEDIKKLTLSIETKESLSPQDKARMMHLYDQNYSLDKGYSEEFRDLIFHGMDEAFDKEGVRFYTLKKENNLIAFIRFEDRPSTDNKQHIYIGSFNVSPELAGSSIGNVMFQECLQKEAGENTVFEAYADATLPISAYYVNQSFVATDIVDLVDRKFFSITMDASINTKLLTKQKPATLSQAQALAENGSPREDIIVQQTTFQNMPTLSSEILKQGFLLTQLVQDKAISKDRVIALFEKQRS